MRVALVDPSLFTWPYDAALALALTEAGHEVRVFGKPLPAADAGPAYGLLHAHFYRGLKPTPDAGPLRSFALARKAVSHTFAMRALLTELRAFGPDVIHFQWTPLPIVDQLFVAALETIAPTVLTVHDSDPFNGNPRAAVQRLAAFTIMSKFARVIVHTRAAQRRVVGYGVASARARVVPHGPLGEIPKVQRARRAHTAVTTVLLFGRLKPYKGVDVLLQAVAKMSPHARAGLRVRIVGQPFMDLRPLREYVREQGLEAQVEIDARYVADDEVASLLAAADVLALPYREIDASGVLMMALGAGVPIVASRIGLFAELLEEGKHGFLVAPGDADGLCQALERLLASAEERARMGREVRQLRDELPSWAEIAAQTTRIYRELVRVPRAHDRAREA